jgi:hypothetical protein
MLSLEQNLFLFTLSYIQIRNLEAHCCHSISGFAKINPVPAPTVPAPTDVLDKKNVDLKQYGNEMKSIYIFYY